jgi:hypothetical protein
MINSLSSTRTGALMSSRFFRLFILVFGVALAGSAVVPREAAAQSDILLRLRSGSPPGDRFRVDSAGGVVAIGELGIGIIPATGAGYRMMWYPFKAAFRAGGTDDGGAGNSWDDANTGFYSWAGGNLTKASAFATFAFGDQTVVTGVDAAGFGGSNTVSGTAGFSTGASNHCTGFGCVAMGFTNTAGGQGSVAIGYRVTADADYAVSLGHRASANGHAGTFNAADQSTTDSLEASASNQFNTRYAGGYRLFTNATTTTGVSLNAGGSSWNVISDRNAKENFRKVENEDILKRIRMMTISTYNYKDDPFKARHIGPMAQDFQKAMKLSADNKSINMSDLDGVTLAGVRALDAKTTELKAQLDAKDKKIQDLEARLARLEAMLQKK